MEIETFLDGETVIQGGSRTDGLYVVLAGALRVTTPAEGADVRRRGPCRAPTWGGSLGL